MRASQRFGGGVRIGQVIQSPVDLEALYPGEFMRLDGRDVLRSAVSSAFAANFAAGVFTATSRTLLRTPNEASVATNGSIFVCPGDSSTAARSFQYSADGVTWNDVTTAPDAAFRGAIIYAGSRFVAVNTAIGSPVVSTDGLTWTSTTGGVACTLVQALAYSPSLGMSVEIPNTGTAIYTLADASTAWVTRTASSQTKYAVCWTGQKFIVLTGGPGGGGNVVANILQISSDGINWTDQYVPTISFSNNAPGPSMASDGNGTVVITIYLEANAQVLVSKDHGETWRNITLPNDSKKYGASPIFVWFVNSKFIILSNAVTLTYGEAMLVSSDGLNWGVEPIGYRGVLIANPIKAVAYKSGVYCFTGPTTSALTATEDATKFRLPETWNYSGVTGQTSFQLRQEFIKVA